MSKLRDAVQNYLAMRRALGFKLRQVGAGLLDFVSFLERRRASQYVKAQASARGEGWLQTKAAAGG